MTQATKHKGPCFMVRLVLTPQFPPDPIPHLRTAEYKRRLKSAAGWWAGLTGRWKSEAPDLENRIHAE